MLLYRITPNRYANDMTGGGAEKYGGRWNLKGTPVLYTTNAASLSALEALVHARDSVGPPSRVLVTYRLPDDVSMFVPDLSSLPAGWDDLPSLDGGPSSQFGQQWIDKGDMLLMIVPSVVMRQATERSVIVDVNHPDFHKLSIVNIKPFSFDSRLIP
jgi:RES domain-containing protein